MPMILSKCPPFLTATATSTMFISLYLEARPFKVEYAFMRYAWETDLDFNWMKVVEEDEKVARASGLLRISIPFWIPVSSSVRKRERSAHSPALTLQPFLVSSKNFSSARIWASVSSRLVLASERALDL